MNTGPVPLPPDDVEGVETPNYPGTDPIDPGLGSLRVHDEDSPQGEFVCVTLVLNTPDGPEEEEVACANREWLGPADPLVERGEWPLVFVPGTDPKEVPDVPGVGEGGLGTVPGQRTPEYTMSATAFYRYDPDRLFLAFTAAGQPVWAPFGPGDAGWFLSDDGAEAGLVVSVVLHRDGENAGTHSVAIPFVGQVLAAMEAMAGTLP